MPPQELLQAAAAAPAVDISAAQARRSDLGAQRAIVEATRAFSEEPNARFLPSVLLNAQSRDINDGPISDRNFEHFVGLSFAWPVFDAGVRGADRAERTAQLRGEELQLELQLRDVERQLRSAAVQVTTEQAALTQATAATLAARRNAEETGVLYREGLASALELADATQQLFDAEVAEATARYRMAVAYLNLREASGVAPVGE